MTATSASHLIAAVEASLERTAAFGITGDQAERPQCGRVAADVPRPDSAAANDPIAELLMIGDLPPASFCILVIEHTYHEAEPVIWRLIAVLAGCLWLASLTLPVTAETKLPGYLVLTLGWLLVPAGQLGWLANLSFIWALISLCSKRSPTRKLTLLSTLLIVAPLSFSFWWNGAGGLETKEAMGKLSYGLGRYVWIASLLLATTAIAVRGFIERERTTA